MRTLLCCLFALATTLPLGAQTQVRKVPGAWTGDRSGPALGGYDLDGDLHADVIIGSPHALSQNNGDVRAISGATGAQIWRRTGPTPGGLFGHALCFTDDRNGDFVPEVVIGEPFWGTPGDQPGAIHVHDGATGYPIKTLRGDDDGEGFGWSVASNFKWSSGPGYDDIAAGAPYDDDGGSNKGSFTVFKGDLSFRALVRGDSPGDHFGWAMSQVRDVDNFGLFDLAVTAPFADFGVFPFLIVNAGQVQVFGSNGVGLLGVRHGAGTNAYFGWSVTGADDVDFDQHDDFVVGSPGYDGAGTDVGRVTMVSGADLSAIGWYDGDSSYDEFGTSLAWLPDLSGDGRHDFVVGAPQNHPGSGYARALRSTNGSELFTVRGEGAGDRYGSHVAWAGDVNFDGTDDVAVGAPFHDLPSRLDAGAVYVYSGACPGFVDYCTAGVTASGCQAAIIGAGRPSASSLGGFSLIATGVEGDKDGLFFFGTNGRQANPWGNGTSYQCVVPPVKRGGLLGGSGTSGACDGVFSQDMNLRWQLKPNQNPGPGAVVQAQCWFRDPFNTSNQTTSLSDALEFAVCP